MIPSRVLPCFFVALASAPGFAASTHPDITGVWSLTSPHATLTTIEGQAPPLTPKAKAIYEQRRAQAAAGNRSFDETTLCLPPGLPRLMLMSKPFEILQRDKVIYFVHELNRLPRRAYIGEKLPAEPDPLYLGYSVARWEGDTLVIDTAGFRDGTLLDDSGLPHSEALRLTERYQLSKDGKTLRVRFTIDDARTFTRAWNTEAQYTRRPGYEIPEDVCAETMSSTHPQERK